MSNAYTAGDELTADALNNPTDSYWYSQTVYFTGSGTFTKGNYPGLRAVRVRAVGGGGGGGGAATTAGGQASCGANGASGGYCEKFILAASLGTNETVTIGAAGSQGSAGNNSGGTAGNTSFGSHVTAGGGGGGGGGPAGTGSASSTGGTGGTATGGDINIVGVAGANTWINAGAVSFMPLTSASPGGFGSSSRPSTTDTGGGGATGAGYGGGGGGGFLNPSQTQVTGGAGSAGIVVVDIFF